MLHDWWITYRSQPFGLRLILTFLFIAIPTFGLVALYTAGVHEDASGWVQATLAVLAIFEGLMSALDKRRRDAQHPELHISPGVSARAPMDVLFAPTSPRPQNEVPHVAEAECWAGVGRRAPRVLLPLYLSNRSPVTASGITLKLEVISEPSPTRLRFGHRLTPPGAAPIDVHSASDVTVPLSSEVVVDSLPLCVGQLLVNWHPELAADSLPSHMVIACHASCQGSTSESQIKLELSWIDT